MPFLKSSLLIVTLLLAVVLPVSASTPSHYKAATKYYQQKNYAQAALNFEKAYNRNQKNAVALYYAAYSYYLARNKGKALELFWKVTYRFPNTKQSENAKAILKSIDKNYSSNANKQSAKKSSRAPGNRISSGSSSLSAEEIVDSLIVVPRPKSKLPAVTPSFVSSVKDLLVKLLLPVLRMLKHRRAKVTIVPSLVEANFRMQNTRPRGNNPVPW